MMSFLKHHVRNCFRLLLISTLFPVFLFAGTKTWTGYGGDDRWQNPLNWSGAALPLSTDDVLLDNGDLPVSYSVTLPDVAVVLRTLLINPSPGRTIEFILPASNKVTNGFSVTGPGYGIELNAGAIFRNASGILSGESLSIGDSIIIHDGAKYIHQTRASHANNILRLLSTSPGTEEGIFDFDVPRASYTISVSNRIYGSLELHSTALGAAVNYTCSGSNPLLVRGNLRMGAGVNVSMDLAGVNGNIQVNGDFIQEGGQLNLSSGLGDNSVLRIKGDLYQSQLSIITETSNGNPSVELNGSRTQEVAMAGRLLNEVGFRLNNLMGATLRLPLALPWKLEMIQGRFISSTTAMLTLNAGCSLAVDSSLQTGSYVDGPIQKLGLIQEDHFLFPVGKEGQLRWLELKNAIGNYTVEYFHQNPGSIAAALGAGLHHISSVEYWSVNANAGINGQSKIELSFASVQSGGVTDPAFLNVARLESAQWMDGGHTAVTGNFIQGSVISGNTDFASHLYTLASTVNLENPLPVTRIDLDIREISDRPIFTWSIKTEEIPDHFELYEETGGIPNRIANVKAVGQKSSYSWTGDDQIHSGKHYYRLSMIDVHGIEFRGEIVPFIKMPHQGVMRQISSGTTGGFIQLLIQLPTAEYWSYEILTANGCRMVAGNLELVSGDNSVKLSCGSLSNGVYIVRANDSGGRNYSLLFVKN